MAALLDFFDIGRTWAARVAFNVPNLEDFHCHNLSKRNSATFPAGPEALPHRVATQVYKKNMRQIPAPAQKSFHAKPQAIERIDISLPASRCIVKPYITCRVYADWPALAKELHGPWRACDAAA
jgi:hypothetical protein